MTISILICVHSADSIHDAMLLGALDSLQKQTYKDFDVFIVFDQCWQHTIEVVKEDSYHFKITKLVRPKKEGLAFAKNFGLKHITSDWIGFLDADDLYMPTKLEKQVEYIKNHDVDFLGTHALNRHYGDNRFFDSCFKLGTYETHEQIKARIYYENIMTHGSMLIRKSCLDELEGYSTDRVFLGQEDWNLWRRAFEKGCKFHQLQERLYVWTAGTSVAR